MGKSKYNWTVIYMSRDEKETIEAVDFQELFYEIVNQEDVLMVMRQEFA